MRCPLCPRACKPVLHDTCVEIFEIEPAAVEKPAELGPASKQITVSVRSEVTVSYETADPSLEARGLIKMLLGVQS